MRRDELQKKLEAELKIRCGYGVNLLKVENGRIIFNYPGNIPHESQGYQIKFSLVNDEVVMAENSQKIIQEVLPPEELIFETSDPTPGIAGTPKAVLSLEEKKIIYGKTFSPRKNQEK
jgi:hypothetical protein